MIVSLAGRKGVAGSRYVIWPAPDVVIGNSLT